MATPARSAADDQAAMLEAAAELIDAAPGTNVLDAFAKVHADDQLRGDTYYALLDYLPPHVELLAPWADTETPERVSTKLRQLARTLRKGGGAHVTAVPHLPAAEPDLGAVAPPPPPGRSERKAARRNFTPDGRLRMAAGQLESRLTRMRRAQHPHPDKITAAELELADVRRQLADLEGGEEEPGELVGAGANGYSREGRVSLSGL